MDAAVADSRGGCISWNCNPDKFKAHLAKFPEKYEGKMLKLLVSDKELVAGGGGKVYKVITWVCRKKPLLLSTLLPTTSFYT